MFGLLILLVSRKCAEVVENFWEVYFRQARLTLIRCSEVGEEEAEEFWAKFSEPSESGETDSRAAESREAEEVEDLLDLM